MPASDGAARDVAPSGTLRVAINTANAALARKGVEGTEPTGVSVDLARHIADALGLPLALIPYESAGKVVAALDEDAWDIAFLAIEPARLDKLTFTRPYVLIEGTYVVREDSPWRSATELDAPGVRIGAGLNSAYDLYLTRTLKHASLLRGPTPVAALELFLSEGLDAGAGVRQVLDQFVPDRPGLRILPDTFMTIEQAVVTRKSRETGASWLAQWVENAKTSGLVRRLLDANGQKSLPVAP